MTQELSSGYLLVGSDSAQIAALRARLVARVEAEDGQVEVLAAAGQGAAAVLRALAQPPLSGGTLLVVLDGADALKAKDGEKIAAYLERPAPDTVLCLVCAKDPVKPLLQAFANSPAVTLRRELPDEAGRGEWVRRAAKRAGVKLAEDAVGLLVDSDPDPRALACELDKLAVYANGARASAGDVRELCVLDPRGEPVPWGLLDAVSVRDGQRALRELHALTGAGSEPAQLVGLVKGRVRRLGQAAGMTRLGASVAQVAAATDQKPFAARKLCAQAKGWELSELALAARRLEGAEREIWYACPEARRLHLERALTVICHRPSGSKD